MEPIFFLIRLPVFLLGLVLFTLLVFVITPFAAVWWFFIVPPLWLIFVVPFKFLEAAFKNRLDVFTSYIEKAVSDWGKKISDNIAGTWGTYEEMGNWLIHGSKD